VKKIIHLETAQVQSEFNAEFHSDAALQHDSHIQVACKRAGACLKGRKTAAASVGFDILDDSLIIDAFSVADIIIAFVLIAYFRRKADLSRNAECYAERYLNRIDAAESQIDFPEFLVDEVDVIQVHIVQFIVIRHQRMHLIDVFPKVACLLGD